MPDPAPAHPLVIAHRGASASAPANSLAAFALAVVQDADGIELDVRRTADGVLVVHHDPTLADGRPVAALTWAELGAGLPGLTTLDEVLGVAGDLLIDIEIKIDPREPGFDPDNGLADAVATWIVRRDVAWRVVVTSFDSATVDRVRALDPGIPTGQLVARADDLVETIAAVASAGHMWIAPHHSTVSGDAVALAHGHGLRMMVWTVDDPERMRELASAGVDGLITNDPALAVATLG
jgi:glycerophosphoryl diester phosphodiesterase